MGFLENYRINHKTESEELTSILKKIGEKKEAIRRGWENSPLQFIATGLQPKQKGDLLEVTIDEFCKTRNIPCVSSELANDDWDRKIYGVPVEIKLAVEGKTGSYVVNQVRDQNYDYLLVFCIAPAVDDIHGYFFYLIDKSIAWENSRGQHGKAKDKHGKFQEKDTKNFVISLSDNKQWYNSYRIDSLAEVLKRLEASSGRS
jgi:hypothetical protein